VCERESKRERGREREREREREGGREGERERAASVGRQQRGQHNLNASSLLLSSLELSDTHVYEP